MEDTSGNAKLYAKLARVMASLERLPKRGHNDYHGYAYVTDGDVADAVRKALADEGIAFLARQVATEANGNKTIVDMEFTFACGETGATATLPWRGEAIDKQDKGIAKAVTSAVKYFLLKTFLISTGDEPDPDAGSEDHKAGERERKAISRQSGNGSATGLAGQLQKLLEAVNERADGYYNHPAHMLSTLKQINSEITGWQDLTGDNGMLSKPTADELIKLLVDHAASKAVEA